MTNKATTKKFFQLVDIKDFRYDGDCSNIDYSDIALDCDTKTISILEAINHISLSLFSMSDKNDISREKIGTLSCIISDLSELAIATNKVSQTAAYLSGIQGENNG